jgi:hypothetical protein
MIKTEEKTAGGVIGSASENKERAANWRRVGEFMVRMTVSSMAIRQAI